MPPPHMQHSPQAKPQTTLRPLHRPHGARPVPRPPRRKQGPATLLLRRHTPHTTVPTPVTPRHVPHTPTTRTRTRSTRLPPLRLPLATTLRLGLPKGSAPTGATTWTATGHTPPGTPRRRPQMGTPPIGGTPRKPRLPPTPRPTQLQGPPRPTAPLKRAAPRPLGRTGPLSTAPVPVRRRRISTSPARVTRALPLPRLRGPSLPLPRQRLPRGLKRPLPTPPGRPSKLTKEEIRGQLRPQHSLSPLQVPLTSRPWARQMRKTRPPRGATLPVRVARATLTVRTAAGATGEPPVSVAVGPVPARSAPTVEGASPRRRVGRPLPISPRRV